MINFNIRISLISMLMLVIAFLFSFNYAVELYAVGTWGVDSDIGVYQLQFDRMAHYNQMTNTIDHGFYGVMWFFTQFLDFKLFLLFCYTLFFCALVVPMYRASMVPYLALFVFLICFFYPAYNSLSSLVLRQGMGFSLLFLTNFFFKIDFKKSTLLKILVASTFHASFLFYYVVVIGAWMLNGLKRISIIWLVMVGLYIANVPLKLVSYLPENVKLFYRLASAEEAEFIVGFKPLFLVLSVLPVLFLLYRDFYEHVRNAIEVQNLYKIYLVANTIALMFSGIPYYDRIMMFSWVLVPVIAVNFLSFLITKIRF